MNTPGQERLYIRALEPTDWELLAERHAVGGDILHLVSRLPRSAVAWQIAAERASQGSPDDRCEFAACTVDGVVVGTVSATRTDRSAGVFSASAWIRPAYTAQSYWPQALASLVGLYFDDLGYRRSELEILATDTSAASSAKRLGFVREGKRRSVILVDGQWCDVAVFGCLTEEFLGR